MKKKRGKPPVDTTPRPEPVGEAPQADSPELTEEMPRTDSPEGKGGAKFLRSTGILCLLFAVCGLVLGLAQTLTEERIAANQGSRNMAVLEEVLPYGGDYREVHYPGDDPTIEAAYEAPEAGWVFQVSPEDSYSGILTLMVGVSSEGAVTGVAVTRSGETEGLGLRASEPAFLGQFTGKTSPVRVEADGGGIAAISGATVTSRAVCEAVNSALAAAGELG